MENGPTSFDTGKIFLFISKYKYLLVIVPILSLIIALVYSFIITSLYSYNVRLLPGQYQGDSIKKIPTFFLQPVQLAEEINMGLFDKNITQKLGIKTDILNLKAEIKGQGIVAITLDAPASSKGIEILSELLAILKLREDTAIAEHSHQLESLRREIGFYMEARASLEQSRNNLREILSRSGGKLTTPANVDSGDRSTSYLFTTGQVYIALVQAEINLLQVNRNLEQLHELSRGRENFREMEIFSEPSRKAQPHYPNRQLIGVVAFFLGLVGAILLALFLDNYSKYKKEKTVLI